MEGWLQVPPERNLMGRGQWKSRYVVLSRSLPVKKATPFRPTTAVAALGEHYSVYPHAPKPKPPPPIPERLPSHHGSLSNGHELGSQFYLTVYKQPNDTEAIAQYPLNEIASCYVGDLGIRHKKPYVILPTLIIHMKTNESASARSFRRRSHDNPYAGKPTQSALFFRPAPEGPSDELYKWSKEIQSRLSTTPPSPSMNQHSSGKGMSEFLINGEPSTALLSPSIRSRSSDLSSDHRSLSSNSEITSQSDNHPQPRSRAPSSPALDSAKAARAAAGIGSPAPPQKRETILDRYFAMSQPQTADSSQHESSIDKFESLMQEEGQNKSKRTATSPLFAELPRKIPSRTQMALDFIAGGLREVTPSSSDEENEAKNTSLITTPKNKGKAPMSHDNEGVTSKNDTFYGIEEHEEDEEEEEELYPRRDSTSSFSGLSIETSNLSITDSFRSQPGTLTLPKRYSSAEHAIRSAPPQQQNFVFEN